MSPISNRLVVRTGPNPGMVFDLTKEITTLGRDVANDIVIGDPEVSRQHSRITRTPGGYVLEDMGSTNGTFVNGERLSAPRVLREGDLLGLSEKVTLTFEALSPGLEETVAGHPAEPRRYAPTMRESAPIPAAPAPMPVEPVTPPPATPIATPPGTPPQPVAEEPPRKRSSWLLAGCGCLVIIAILVVVLWYMDAYHPDILYAPLRLLGF
jgi:predicted component of type VI protein secretion system